MLSQICKKIAFTDAFDRVSSSNFNHPFTKTYKAFSVHHATTQVGVTKKLEGDTPGIADPSDQRDVPYPMAPHIEKKSREKKEEGGNFRVMAFVIPISCYKC